MATIDLGRVVGKSAYEIACDNGFEGTEQEWLDSMNYDELIPPQASAENQLADKDFVNSSIATATAEFIGTFNSLAELQATTKTYDNNDYAFVIGKDSDGNTEYSRYKWNGSEWIFEYTLNNSSFTSEQWKAINSNVTDEWRQSVNTSISNKADSSHSHDNLANKDLSNVDFNKVKSSNKLQAFHPTEGGNHYVKAVRYETGKFNIRLYGNYLNDTIKDQNTIEVYKSDISTKTTGDKNGNDITTTYHSKEDLNIKRFGQPYGKTYYITIQRHQTNLDVGNIEVYNSHAGKWFFPNSGSVPFFFGNSGYKNYAFAYAWDGYETGTGYTKLHLRVSGYGNVGVASIGATNNDKKDVSISISDWTTTAPEGITFKNDVLEIATKNDLSEYAKNYHKGISNPTGSNKYYVIKNIPNNNPIQIMGSVSRVDSVDSVFNFTATGYTATQMKIVGIWNNSNMYGQTWKSLPFKLFRQSNNTYNLWVEIPSYSVMKVILTTYNATDYNFVESAFDDTGTEAPQEMSIKAHQDLDGNDIRTTYATKAELEEIKKKNDELNEYIVTLENNNEDLLTRIDNLQRENTMLNVDITTLQSNNRDLQTENLNLKSQITSLNIEIQNLNNYIRQLEDQIRWG